MPIIMATRVKTHSKTSTLYKWKQVRPKIEATTSVCLVLLTKCLQICLKWNFSILQHCFIRGSAQKTEVQGALAGTPHDKKTPTSTIPNPEKLLVPTHLLTAFKKLSIFSGQEFTIPVLKHKL